MAFAARPNSLGPTVPADSLLIIDLGTQSLRATVFNRTGQAQWQYSQPIVTARHDGECEQDPAEWHAALRHVLLEIGRQPALAANLAGIAATGTLSGLVCLDAQDRPLRNAILYADARPAAQVAQLEAHPEFAPVREQYGWRSVVGDFLPQLLYLRQQEPTIYAQSARLLDSTGALNYFLTGIASLDAFTLFTCYATPGTSQIPRTLCDAFDLDPAKLGTPMQVGQLIGTLRPELCHEYGLPACPVFSAPYDSACAYLGAHLQSTGEALDISGTVTSFGVLHHSQVRDANRRIYSLPLNDLWLVRGSTAMSGAALEWARAVLLRGTYDELDRAVADSPPGANGVIFLPYLAGERAPLWNPGATGVFSGLRGSSTLPDMLRAVVEGICYSLLHIQTVMEENGVRIGDVLLAGGLSRNHQFNRIKASVTGRRLVPLDNYELTTFGVATIAGCALGWWTRGQAASRFVKRQTPLDPDPAANAIYRAGFDRYLAASRHFSA